MNSITTDTANIKADNKGRILQTASCHKFTKSDESDTLLQKQKYTS